MKETLSEYDPQPEQLWTPERLFEVFHQCLELAAAKAKRLLAEDRLRLQQQQNAHEPAQGRRPKTPSDA